MHLFFYGTLIAGSGNPVARAAHRRLRDRGPATAAGVLHAIPHRDGWYPALLPGAGRVHGRLYAALAGFSAADLARLDAYEDFDPADPDGSLYLRAEVAVARPGGGAVRAQAYRFNRPLPPGAQPIAGGSFVRWLARTGARAFGTPSARG